MKKYENFAAALHNLEDIYHYQEPYENVILTGMVALYEICFEQSWKAMKEIGCKEINNSLDNQFDILKENDKMDRY